MTNKQKYNTFFLDRDGVINENKFVNSVEDFTFLPESLKALRLLKQLRHPVIIITNQGGIEAGYLTEQTLEEIHNSMLGEIIKTGGWVKDIFYCPHINPKSQDRKPNPGMLLKALDKYEIPNETSCFIGDHITDWQAAIAAGIDPIAVKSSRNWEKKAYSFIKKHKIPIHENLLQAVKTHAQGASHVQ